MTDDLLKCFKTLDVEPSATPEAVKQAYRDWAKILHPDRFMGDERLLRRGQEKLKEVNVAYEKIRAYQSADLPRNANCAGTPPKPPPEPPANRSKPPSTPESGADSDSTPLKVPRVTAKTILLWICFLGDAQAFPDDPFVGTLYLGFILGILAFRGWMTRTAWKVASRGHYTGIARFYCRCMWRYFWRSFLMCLGFGVMFVIVRGTGEPPAISSRRMAAVAVFWVWCSPFVLDVPWWVWRRLHPRPKEPAASSSKQSWDWQRAGLIAVMILAVCPILYSIKLFKTNPFKETNSSPGQTQTAAETTPAPARSTAAGASSWQNDGSPDFIPDTPKGRDFISHLSLAESGDSEAQFFIARAYKRGYGVAQNPVLAVEWTIISAKAGNKQAADNLEVLKVAMPGDFNEGQRRAANFVPQKPSFPNWDEAQSDPDIWSHDPTPNTSEGKDFISNSNLALSGDSEAQFFIARAFETGNGVTQDLTKAVAWATISAKGGNQQAAAYLNHLKTIAGSAVFSEGQRRVENFDFKRFAQRFAPSEKTAGASPHGGN